MQEAPFDRVILLVCDSVGVGEAPDAKLFGDVGANTLGNIQKWYKQRNLNFKLPTLERWGLSQILPQHFAQNQAPEAATAVLIEQSPGKDTTTGHWEIAGTVLEKSFPTFPTGYAPELLNQWAKDNSLPGWLGNKSASGTAIIEEFGEEHIKTGKPIVYTSADSVLQIACSEESFGLERLYNICRSARTLVDPLGVGRVIARPFIGKNKKSFQRTENRKDFSVPPPTPNLLDCLHEKNFMVAAVGKIEDIFAHRSMNLVDHTGNNPASVEATIKIMRNHPKKRGLIFTNLIDFDQHYGHRRDPLGYGQCLMDFDTHLTRIANECGPKDLLLVTADHGNDPTHTGTDHTRENVPLFIWNKANKLQAKHLGSLKGYHHITNIIFEALGLKSETNRIKDLNLLPETLTPLLK